MQIKCDGDHLFKYDEERWRLGQFVPMFVSIGTIEFTMITHEGELVANFAEGPQFVSTF